MINDVGHNVSRAIKEKKLLKISYENRKGSITTFIIGIKDIDIDNKKLKVTLFNEYTFIKDGSVIDYNNTFIYFSKIKEATVLEVTEFDSPTNLIDKIERNKTRLGWLQYDLYSHNVLNYYAECDTLNNDPARSDFKDVPGIDASELAKHAIFHLTDEQNKDLFSKVLNEYDRSRKHKYYILALNRLSISREDEKIYVIAYNAVRYDPLGKMLILEKEISFNLAFAYSKDKKRSLEEYVDGSLEDWMNLFKIDHHKAIENLILRGSERADEVPHLMVLERSYSNHLKESYNEIATLYLKNKLPLPLKAFFGNLSSNDYKPVVEEPLMVTLNDYIDSSQLKVVYNTLKYPVTYVQGPPGTGKTQTISNVVLSCLFEGRRVMVCSQNNKAVDEVIKNFNFVYDNKKVPLPFIRLGNELVIIEAIDRIRKLYKFDTKKFNVNALNFLKTTQNHLKNENKSVVEALKSCEKYTYFQECIDSYYQLKDMNEGDKKYEKKVQKTIDTLEEAKTHVKKLEFQKVKGHILNLSKDETLKRYFYYICLYHISLLKDEKNEDLINICFSENKDDRAAKFTNYLSIPENMAKFNEIFPIIFITNHSAYKLGGPKYRFSLVIMDESGQCDVANALVPIAKGDSLMLVGDVKQLRPVITLSKQVNDQLLKDYNVQDIDTYNFYSNSIYSTMTKADHLSKELMLDKHYRSGRKIIEFSNERYYEDKLEVLSNKGEGKLEFVHIDNSVKNKKNAWVEEASAIVSYIKRNSDREEYKNCYIVTPFHDQADLLNNMLEEADIDSSIRAGTIHSLQGAEKDTIIFSPAISYRTSKNTYRWLRNNQEIINVAVTRAKKQFIVIGDDKAIKYHSKGIDDDLSLLVKYVKSKGEVNVSPLNDVSVTYKRSNLSKNEDDFFKTVNQYCSVNKSYEVKRNVDAKEVVGDKFLLENDYEFDFVIYKKNLFGKKPVLIIELNGGEHLGTVSREKSDRAKKDIADRLGIKLVFLPNSYSKRYTMIDALLENKRNLNKIIKEIVE